MSRWERSGRSTRRTRPRAVKDFTRMALSTAGLWLSAHVGSRPACHRIGRDQGVGLVGRGEVQALGHARIVFLAGNGESRMSRWIQA